VLGCIRNFDSKELDARDWIAAEREYLIKMADAESEVEKRKTDGGVWRQYVGLLVSSLSHHISHTPLTSTLHSSPLFISDFVILNKFPNRIHRHCSQAPVSLPSWWLAQCSVPTFSSGRSSVLNFCLLWHGAWAGIWALVSGWGRCFGDLGGGEL
jgi:hypothetical protein